VDVDSWQPGAFAMKPFAPLDANAIHFHKPQRYGSTEIGLEKNLNPRVSESLWPGEVVASGFSRKDPAVALRRFRFPVPARVRVDHGKPSRVVTDRRGLSGGRVDMCAGPWRTSGGWWSDGPQRHRDTEKNINGLCASVPLWPVEVKSWDRDEWDVTLGDGATYRLFRERAADAWFIEGIVD